MGWGMLAEWLVRNSFLGRGCGEEVGELHSLPSSSAWWGNLHRVARGQVWRRHIFIDVPIVACSYSWYLNNSCRFWQLSPFWIYESLFYFGEVSEDPWAWGQSKNRLVYGIPGDPALFTPVPCCKSVWGCKHLSHRDRRKSWGSGLVCWAPKLLFREEDREGTRIERFAWGPVHR